MDNFSKYIGLDTHKDSIAVAIAQAGRSNPVYYGEIANTPDAVSKLVKRLNPEGEVLAFCYEAGPCGYGLYRQITQLGHQCDVVAPSLIPTRPGVRVKTDRRDSESHLARYIVDVVEWLDLSELERAYAGRGSVPPVAATVVTDLG